MPCAICVKPPGKTCHESAPSETGKNAQHGALGDDLAILPGGQLRHGQMALDGVGIALAQHAACPGIALICAHVFAQYGFKVTRDVSSPG